MTKEQQAQLINVQEKQIESLTKSETRLSEIVNQLNAENASLKENRPYRDVAFAPTQITSEEQKTIGDFIDTPILDLISKWFKSKADQNNDLLLHSSKANDEQKCLYRLAVLMWEDWKMFITHCERTLENSKPKDEVKKNK